MVSNYPHLLGQILQGGAGAGVQSHPAVRHRDEFRHKQASDESAVAGGVRPVRLHDSAVYRVFRLTRRRAALPCLPDAQRIRPEHHPFDCYMLMLVFMFAGWTVPQWIVTLITPFANANAFAAMAMIGLMMEIPDNHKDRSELGKVIAWRFLFSIIIALSAWFFLPLDERVREIVVLAAFAPVTIFSTKFTDSLTGNAKLAGFSLTVTAIIGLTFMTILHAALPVA